MDLSGPGFPMLLLSPGNEDIRQTQKQKQKQKTTAPPPKNPNRKFITVKMGQTYQQGGIVTCRMPMFRKGATFNTVWAFREDPTMTTEDLG